MGSKPTINRIADGYARFAKWVAVISGVVVVILMVYTVADVAGRYIANRPMPGAYEFANIFLIYITYFGVTLVQARGGHMRLGFLYEREGTRGKALIDLISVLFGIFIVGIIAWQGWIYALDSWRVQEVTMGSYTLPVFPGRIALAIGATIFLVQYVIDVIKNILLLINPGNINAAGPVQVDVNAPTGEAGAKS
jgi:TRAP-type C4-dicarboxylate transport system permease small subunit